MKNAINKEFNNGSWRANDNFHQIITKSNIYKIINSLNDKDWTMIKLFCFEIYSSSNYYIVYSSITPSINS